MHITHWEPHGVWQHFFDEVSGRERLAAMRRMLGDERFARARYLIVDYTGTLSYHINDADLAELRQGHAAAARAHVTMRVAVVNVAQPAIAVSNRLQALGRFPAILRRFTSLQAARAWIAGDSGV